MPAVPRHHQLKPGTIVSIILKADQRTGRQVQGTVAQTLTRGDHPHGVKVKLTDGRVGRVQQIVSQATSTPVNSNISTTNNGFTRKYHSSAMNPEQNPWQTSESQGNPYIAPGSQGGRGENAQQQNYYSQVSQSNPWDSHPSQQQSQNPPYPPRPQNQQSPQSQYQPPPGPPTQRVQRSETDLLLAQQDDGSAQVEQFQHYEAQSHGRETQDDRNQAQLQKEFPNIDSSLIAALYGDTKSVSECREMLQELASSS